MPRAPRIDVVRLWTQRHAHHDLHLAEDGQGRIWLRLRDLRHWMPGLPPDAEMLRRLPTQLALADASREPYIDTDALAPLTRKAQNPGTLKLMAFVIYKRRLHTKERQRGRTRLEGGGAGQRPSGLDRPAGKPRQRVRRPLRLAITP